MKAHKVAPCVGIPDLHHTLICKGGGGETVSLWRPECSIRVTRREGQEFACREIQNVRVLWPGSKDDTMPIGRHVYVFGQIIYRRNMAGHQLVSRDDIPYLHCSIFTGNDDTRTVGRPHYIEITRRCRVINGKDATPGNGVTYLHCHLVTCDSFY